MSPGRTVPGPQASAAYAALDPGRSKCGLVRCDAGGTEILSAGVLDPESCWQQLQQWQQQGLIAAVVLGNGTGSDHWRQRLTQLTLPVLLVDEAGTTLAARQRFWQLEPARGWRRLLPQGLRLPPRDVDDVVAQLLLERHLQRPLRRSDTQWLPRIRTSPAP
jgi:RNase H-fold protein (predicted Holliday junction resolvase)